MEIIINPNYNSFHACLFVPHELNKLDITNNALFRVCMEIFLGKSTTKEEGIMWLFEPEEISPYLVQKAVAKFFDEKNITVLY